MAEWSAMTLADAGITLIDCVHKTPMPVGDGYPYVTIPEMKNGRIDFKNARRISEPDFIEWTKKAKPQLHDVVLSRRTNPGVTATFGSECNFALGQNLVLLRADGRHVLPEFLRWMVKAPTWWEQIGKFINVGAVFDSLRCGDVPRFELPIPSLADQKAISSLLCALDDKIDLNRRMNETLEAMARAIFKDWFVDFGPTRAKMEGRAPYLAPETWALFPNRLDDEGKPEGWTNLSLKELATQSGGQIRTGPFGSQLHKADYLPIGTPVVMPTNLTSGEIVAEGIARVGPDMANRMGDHALNEGDIVYGRRGDIGRKALVGPDEAGWLCGTGCLRINIRSDACPPLYIYHHLDRPEIQEWISTRAIGATMPNLNTGILGSVRILAPTALLGAKVSETMNPFFQRVRANRRENNALAATRDLLLPKLMSGEIRVKDAEKSVEAAA